ncbi:archaeosortase/exosortase family protein [Sphingomonas sp.]|uniref:archaeosortase/exosortase family protein n=1 Tax=Sphingomonas sp. TaxID=28214 RepID=UPI001B0B9F56|nr:archaeosortase/exosortase family protein [Sphingomonas sp.]MBO9712287.1 archaeosortase/exosortase family protein [Sphingomonas sp.]
MRGRIALPLLAAANWDAWWLLVGRAEDLIAQLLAAVLLGAFAWAWHRTPREAELPAPVLLVALLASALAGYTGPALLQIGVAVAAMVWASRRASGRRVPLAPLTGLALLALPVLPTLDFLLTWPLRRVSAMLSVGLLRMNGVELGLEGVALDWHGKLLLFDAPCSGVRMLWAALLLASILALAGGFGPWRYLRALSLATAIAVAGNALRAASLFYLENGFVPQLAQPWAHEAIGLVAFALLAAATLAAIRLPRKAFA